MFWILLGPCFRGMPPRKLDASSFSAMQSALAAVNTEPGQLCLSSKGLKRSRAGSAKGADEKDKVVTADVVITKEKVKHTPDGKVCFTCPRKDDDEDPVARVLGKVNEDGSVILMGWGYPPKDGKTVGDYCYYCVRVWLKDGRVFGKNLSQWKAALAKQGEKGISLHHQRVIPQI